MKSETKKEKASRRKAAYEKKCKEYARFLRQDHDYDWAPILHLLRYKLKRTRQCIAKGLGSDRVAIAAEIKGVEDLLWRVLEFDYHAQAFAKFDKKYGRPKFKLGNKDANGHIKVQCIYKNGKPSTKAMRKRICELGALADANQRADIFKALFIMADRIFTWWD